MTIIQTIHQARHAARPLGGVDASPWATKLLGHLGVLLLPLASSPARAAVIDTMTGTTIVVGAVIGEDEALLVPDPRLGHGGIGAAPEMKSLAA